jgi:hypothetical protein
MRSAFAADAHVVFIPGTSRGFWGGFADQANRIGAQADRARTNPPPRWRVYVVAEDRTPIRLANPAK